MDDARDGQGPRPDRDTDGGGGDVWFGLNDDAPSRRQRPQPSGAQNRRAARERARAQALAGQLEIKFPIRVADCEPLVLTGDLSEDDLATSARLSAALAELLRDMVRHYASRLEEHEPRALSLYALALPSSRTALGEATLADLEIARHNLRREASLGRARDDWSELPRLMAAEDR
jgi:hypothetical protein